jgi:hypothetical protein
MLHVDGDLKWLCGVAFLWWLAGMQCKMLFCMQGDDGVLCCIKMYAAKSHLSRRMVLRELWD